MPIRQHLFPFFAVWQAVQREERGKHGKALARVRTVASVKGILKKGSSSNLEIAKQIGKLIAERAIKKDIKEVAFDRSGFIYHGRVKALAESAREAGLKF